VADHQERPLAPLVPTAEGQSLADPSVSWPGHQSSGDLPTLALANGLEGDRVLETLRRVPAEVDDPLAERRLGVDLRVADAWRKAYPGASIGILALDGVENPPEHPALAEHVRRVEEELRRLWAGGTRADLNQLPEFEAYRGYYRRFGKTYHVQLQLESVVLKGKPLRANGCLVLAMFAAELRNLLLTAGHDLAMVEGDVSIEVAQGGERYVGLGGRELALQPGDMHIRDEVGILSSVLYGPDDRTQIAPNTRRAIFCVYAPTGIRPEAVARHLADIASTVRLFAPQASVIQQQVYAAS
jgi:DNA/RNA-binding domain of Phe-tRNA-synthetase-like protein